MTEYRRDHPKVLKPETPKTDKPGELKSNFESK